MFDKLWKSVNDVVLGVTEAGLSRYLNSIYGQIIFYYIIYILKYLDFDFMYLFLVNNREKGGENNLPKNLGIRSTVVFNLRPSPTIEVIKGFQLLFDINNEFISMKN